MRFFLIFSSYLLGAQLSFAQTPDKLKLAEEIQRERMITMTRQLGVTCNTCHDSSNFTSQKKPAYKIALEHIKLTQILIDHGMDGKNNRPKADCYMCHRGKAVPDYKEPFNPLTMKKGLGKKKTASSHGTDSEPEADPSSEEPGQNPLIPNLEH